jgi:carboxypeptidase PM20D1
MKTATKLILGLLTLLLCITLVRTLTFAPTVVEPVDTQHPAPPVVVEHLSESLRFETISGERFDASVFVAFQEWMKTTYPYFHRVAQREVIAGHSLLFTWPGRDSSRAPVLFLAHQDVVPIEKGTESHWTHPPFSGAVAPCGDEKGQCVWGRGAIDMKAALVGLLEGAEALARVGWSPSRTLIFAFGHDEEVGGSGAQEIAAHLKRTKVRAEWVLDEGLLITDGITPGVTEPVAYIGVAEKGYLSLELIASGEGGHSSMPPPSTAVGRLARAVSRLEADPFPAKLDGLSGSMFEEVGPHMPFGLRFAFANRWLLGSIILKKLTAKVSTNATVRTTQAVTMFSGSLQDNVLPQRASAVVNYRIHPRDSIAGVTRRVREVIDDDGIVIKKRSGGLISEPSKISAVDGAGFRSISRAIRGAFPGVIVAPGLFIAATDSRHYTDVVDNIYRFHPIWMGPTDGARIHGTNERIRAENFRRAVTFYQTAIKYAGR